MPRRRDVLDIKISALGPLKRFLLRSAVQGSRDEAGLVCEYAVKMQASRGRLVRHCHELAIISKQTGFRGM